MLASADPTAGDAGTGPNPDGVVGAPHGHVKTSKYTSALKSKQEPWTFGERNQWLTKPTAYTPGTRMTFVAIEHPKERADVIDYPQTLSANPGPLAAAKRRAPLQVLFGAYARR